MNLDDGSLIEDLTAPLEDDRDDLLYDERAGGIEEALVQDMYGEWLSRSCGIVGGAIGSCEDASKMAERIHGRPSS